MRKIMMTLAAVLSCAMTTSVFTACSVEDNPAPEVVTDSKPFPYDQYMDTSVRPGDDFFRYQYGAWLDDAQKPSLNMIISQEMSNMELDWIINSDDPVLCAIRQLAGNAESDNAGRLLLKARLDYLSAIQTQEQLLEAFAQLHKWGYTPLVRQVAFSDQRVIKGMLTTEYPSPYMKAAYHQKNEEEVASAMARICGFLADFGFSNERIEEIKARAEAVSLLEMKAYDRHINMIRKMQDPENHMSIRRALSLTTQQACELMGMGDLADQMIENPDADDEAVIQQLLSILFDGTESSVAMMRDYMIAYVVSMDIAYFNQTADTRVSLAIQHAKYYKYRMEAEKVGLQNISKEKCTEMMEEFRSILIERIGNLDWMGNATKQAAQEKARMMDFYIGYPDKWNDEMTPKIEAGTLLEAVDELRLHEVALNRQIIGKTTAVAGWDYWCSFVTFTTYNAMYDSSNNQLIILPAFLTAPAFDFTLSESTLYATAFVFGHEMCHGFDAGGSKHDEVGAERDWWSPADKAAFESKQQQLITLWGQLEHYPGQPANGESTLKENMADFGGVTLALEAYSRRLHQQGFSGEDFDKQIRKFWLAYGMPVGVEERERSLDALKQSYTNDIHSAGHNRVNGIVRLFDDWYRLYDVKPTDKLYVAPEDRVKIW